MSSSHKPLIAILLGLCVTLSLFLIMVLEKPRSVITTATKVSTTTSIQVSTTPTSTSTKNSTSTPSEDPTITVDKDPVPPELITSQSSSSTYLAKQYTSSQFRVLNIVTTSSAKFYIVIARDRTDGPLTSDGCGSIYTAHTCYFFIEPKYWADAPDTRFIGSLTQIGNVDWNSFNFISPSLLEFSTGEGDAGAGFISRWQLDIPNNKFTRVSNEFVNYN